MKDVFLTTFDNPFDPFTDFDSWLLFDKEHDYDSCEKVARLAKITNEMTEEEELKAIEKAIDRVIQIDFLNIYKKIYKTPH